MNAKAQALLMIIFIFFKFKKANIVDASNSIPIAQFTQVTLSAFFFEVFIAQ
jgi:hypothetical protein